jgi:zinc transport system substrate-binding protein
MSKKIIKYILVGIIILAAIGLLIFASNRRQAETNGKLTVATSFYPLYYLTKQIVGDQVNVVNITPSGVEPHDYEPTTGDIIKIETSRLLVLNGGQLEPWGDKIKKQLADSGDVVVVTAGQSIIDRYIKNDSNQTALDPHVWLDPVLAKTEASVISQALIKVDPIHKTEYQKNLSELNRKLTDLDNEYRSGLKTCSQAQIVTSHAAFGYLAAEYGFKQIAITGLSPDSEPSPSQLANIVNQAKTNQIKYIFFESLTSPKLSQMIASETGAKTMVLNPIEGLTPDDVAAGRDYLSIMRDNLVNLRLAMICK